MNSLGYKHYKVQVWWDMIMGIARNSRNSEENVIDIILLGLHKKYKNSSILPLTRIIVIHLKFCFTDTFKRDAAWRKDVIPQSYKSYSTETDFVFTAHSEFLDRN